MRSVATGICAMRATAPLRNVGPSEAGNFGTSCGLLRLIDQMSSI
jgi:hypothetical protein